jgi:hypothetical protein
VRKTDLYLFYHALICGISASIRVKKCIAPYLQTGRERRIGPVTDGSLPHAVAKCAVWPTSDIMTEAVFE